MPELLAIGAGYAARPLLMRLAGEGWRVTATTRDTGKARGLADEGLTPLVWAASDPLPADALARADALLVSVPPRGGCPVLAAMPPGTVRRGARVLYLSATSVYGDHGGGWVDEETPARPGTERGRARLAAEAGWRALAEGAGARVTLCRLAGIYGPGRNAVESLRGDTRGARAGLAQRVIKPGHVFSRIHRDDIVRGLAAVLGADAPPGVLNFADDLPCPPQDVIAHAARLLGRPPPPEVAFADADLSETARGFYAENKRVGNAGLRALIGPLTYPTYREGLAALA